MSGRSDGMRGGEMWGGDRSAARSLPWAWLLLLLTVGLALRLAGLTERGLWQDELTSLQVAARPLADIAAGRVFDNHTPPLYYLLLHLWLVVVPPTLAGLRALSVVCDLACLALLASTASRWLGRRTGLLVGAAYAVSPFAVRLCQEGRMYPLVMLLTVLAAALAVEVEARPERRWPAVALTAVATAMLYTHYYAALSLLALNAVMAWRLRRTRHRRRRWWWAMSVAAMGFMPWLPKVLGLVASGGQYFRGAGLFELPHALLRFTVGYSLLPVTVEAKDAPWATVFAHLPLLAALVLTNAAALGLAAWRVWRGDGSGSRFAAAPPLFLALAALPPLLAFAVSLAVPSLDERYLAVSFPFYVVLVVFGLTVAGARWPRTAAAVGLAALWLAGAAAQVARPAAGVTAWRPAVAELRRLAPPGSRVAVNPGTYHRLTTWYLGDRYQVWQAETLPPAERAGRRRETWMIEVVYLAHARGLLRVRGWRESPRWEDDAGNGIRIYRLVPAATVPAATVPDTAPPAEAGPPRAGRR